MKRPAARRKAAKAVDLPEIEEISQPGPEEERPPPPMGDNKPPGPSLGWDAEAWAEHMVRVFAAALERKEDLLASYTRFADGYPIEAPRDGSDPAGIDKWSDDIQGRAGDLKDKIAALLKNAEALHTIEKAPIIVAQRAVDGHYRNFRQTLETAITEINRRRTIYGRHIEAKNRRAAEEEAQRKADEAALAATQAAATLEPEHLEKAAEAIGDAEDAAARAAAKPAEHSRVYGPAGSVSSLRDNWQFIEEESDVIELARAVIEGKAPRTYLAFNASRISLAVRSEKVRAIPGCVIRNEQKVT